MKYCRNCLNVSTRPNIKFDEHGICPACSAYKSDEEIDWESRLVELDEIVRFAREKKPGVHDCILGVSGGKDSTRQALFIKENMGLNPLLVSMNYPPTQVSQRGVDNLANLIDLGFDCISLSCGSETWRKAMKEAFIRFGNWAKATEYALHSSVPRLAIAYQIPLVFWGENPARALGDLGTQGTTAYDGNRLKYGNTIGGGNLDWLLDAGFSRNELLQYSYPSDDEMQKAGLRIVFMDYFMPSFDLRSNGDFSVMRGLHIKKANPISEPDLYGTSMLDEDFFNINMHIRYLKYGFGRTNDIVSQEIRSGRLSRSAGIDLVDRYDGNYDEEILTRFCDFLEISEQVFWDNVDRYVSKILFERLSQGVYRKKYIVGTGL